MRGVLAASFVLVAFTGCKKQREGLPPADQWGTGEVAAGALPQVPGMAPPGGGGANPHGDGMAFGTGGNPHSGENPHAGMNMGGMAGGDPHAGIDMSQGGAPDVTSMLPPPDPNRKIDPNRRLTGVLKLDPKLASRVKPSSVVFVFAKRAGADGQPTGFPIASERLTWTDAPQLAFSLTEENLMSAGTELTGDVVLMARVDQDEDAGSRQPGDVTGQVRVKVPADNLTVTFDTVLP